MRYFGTLPNPFPAKGEFIHGRLRARDGITNAALSESWLLEIKRFKLVALCDLIFLWMLVVVPLIQCVLPE